METKKYIPVLSIYRGRLEVAYKERYACSGKLVEKII
jgi:hypothetical protein